MYGGLYDKECVVCGEYDFPDNGWVMTTVVRDGREVFAHNECVTWCPFCGEETFGEAVHPLCTLIDGILDFVGVAAA